MKKKITLKSFLIANGNPTLLVWNCPNAGKHLIIKKNLGNVQQIGFIEQNNTLIMMGNELCINATIAFASQLGNNGTLYIGGIKSTVDYTNTIKETAITLNLSVKCSESLVLLEGIGFYCNPNPSQISKDFLNRLCLTYKLPAFGYLTQKLDQIIPWVYVLETNSLIKETSCGSGSIAANIMFNINKVRQPSGGIITVNNKNGKFTISAQVKNI